ATLIAEQDAACVDRYWEQLSSLLASPYSYQRACAVNVLVPIACRRKSGDETAELVRALESTFPSESTVNARYILHGLGRIAVSVHEFRGSITEFLLRAVTADSPNSALLRSDVIDAFSDYAQLLPDRERVIAYVRQQLHSSSPRTRKSAREFLKKFAAASAGS
ncbi:MAG TPA: hypothetical protein VMW87_05225, partial [Spirochaetia bacterium]|nr:hypothetical protein [Spirochaetia bacterium]